MSDTTFFVLDPGDDHVTGGVTVITPDSLTEALEVARHMVARRRVPVWDDGKPLVEPFNTPS
jgi:hypothetical protein